MQRIHIKELRRFCNRQLGIYDQVKSLTDHRKKHEIPLSHIFYTLFYTIILSKNSFLSKDKIARKPYFKQLIGSKRKMVASDSTLKRALSSNMRTDELQQIPNSVHSKIDDSHFIDSYLHKKCAIIDGSHFGKYMKEVLLIPGKTDYILNFTTIPKRGKELVSAKEILLDTTDTLGKGYFDLVLSDGLYYSKNMFALCREKMNSHLLVKTSERLNVVKDVENIIAQYPNDVETATGFDSDRFIKYTVKTVKDIEADTIDYPLQVAVVEEINPKKDDEKTVFYVITSDLSMSAKQLRYAAHLRWRIENNGFKELNNLYTTKRYYTKNETCFTNLLWMIVLAYSIFHLFLFMVEFDTTEFTGKTVFKDYVDYIFESLVSSFSYDTS